MNKDIFWAIIETARSASAGNLAAMVENLKQQLLQLTVDDVLDFDSILKSYMTLSDKKSLLTVVSIIKEQCTDDGFEDFQCWLIAQGKDAYFAALKNPDTLADLEITNDPLYGTAEFCDLRYVAVDAYEALTGENFWDQDFTGRYQSMIDLLAGDIEYIDDADKWITMDDVLTCFPKITKKYIGPDFI